jgi:hypothetical protein
VYQNIPSTSPPRLDLARPRASTRKRTLVNHLSLVHKHKVMIVIHKHWHLESLRSQDLPLQLEVFSFSYAYFFAPIGGFLWFSKIKFLQQVLDKNLSPSSLMSLK